MKCVCGYEYLEDRNNSGMKNIKGDKDFIRIDGTFYAKDEKGEVKTVRLCVCPKCHTVKMDL